MLPLLMRRQARLCEPAPDLITGVNWDEAWMSRSDGQTGRVEPLAVGRCMAGLCALGCRQKADETPTHGPAQASTSKHHSPPKPWTVQHNRTRCATAWHQRPGLESVPERERGFKSHLRRQHSWLHGALSAIVVGTPTLAGWACCGVLCRRSPTWSFRLRALSSRKAPTPDGKSSRSALDQSRDPIGGFLVGLRQDVAVDIERDGHRRVPQPGGDNLGIDAETEFQGSLGMPQAVQWDAGQSGRPQVVLEGLAHRCGSSG